MSQLWKTIPLFISSTFRDMHAERDQLNRVVFPAIEERLKPRRCRIAPIDLRVGVETDSTQTERERELQILKVCLAEIERSRGDLGRTIGTRFTRVVCRCFELPKWLMARFLTPIFELSSWYRFLMVGQCLPMDAYAALSGPENRPITPPEGPKRNQTTDAKPLVVVTAVQTRTPASACRPHWSSPDCRARTRGNTWRLQLYYIVISLLGDVH